MTITAKFASICPACNGHITPGQRVEWSKGSKASHVTCGASQAAPRSAYPRRQLVNGDIYRSRRTGERAVFGCSACSRLGRMCAQCRYDDE